MGISFRGVDLHFPRNDLRLSPAFWVAGDCWFGERAGEASRHSLRGAPEIQSAPGNLIASKYVAGKQDAVIHVYSPGKKKPELGGLYRIGVCLGALRSRSACFLSFPAAASQT